MFWCNKELIYFTFPLLGQALFKRAKMTLHKVVFICSSSRAMFILKDSMRFHHHEGHQVSSTYQHTVVLLLGERAEARGGGGGGAVVVGLRAARDTLGARQTVRRLLLSLRTGTIRQTL